MFSVSQSMDGVLEEVVINVDVALAGDYQHYKEDHF